MAHTLLGLVIHTSSLVLQLASNVLGGVSQVVLATQHRAGVLLKGLLSGLTLGNSSLWQS